MKQICIISTVVVAFWFLGWRVTASWGLNLPQHISCANISAYLGIQLLILVSAVTDYVP